MEANTVNILYALSQAIQPQNLFATTIGSIIGIICGGIPGLTASMAIVICLPITFHMDPIPALSLLLGIYIGAMSGCAISSILINIPGSPAAIITGSDGYPMAKKGEAGKAIFISYFSGAVGSMVSFIPLFICAPILAKFAMGFNSPELFAVVLLGMVVICCFSAGGSPKKGIISGLLGMAFMTVGLDRVECNPRFTFGTIQLQYGVHFLPVMVGLFAIPQTLMEMKNLLKKTLIEKFETEKKWLPSNKEILGLTKVSILASAIGVLVGIVPGTGSAVASMFAYQFQKRISKHPEKFGTGIGEGVAASEAANNGVTGGALIPMLTLGIPGDPVTAIMYGALMIQGLDAGPLLFKDHGDVVYGMFGSFFIATLLTFFIGVIGLRLFTNVLKIPKKILFPIILIFCVIGTYALRSSYFDVGVMLFFGIVGHVMIRNGYPFLPLIIAIILGPPLEVHLRMALITSCNSPWVFFTSKISLSLLIATGLIIVYAAFANRKLKLQS